MTDQDLLQNVVTVVNREEEDGVLFHVSRKEVFIESGLHPTLRPWFNGELRRMEKEGLVELTRQTVAVTDEGFLKAWE